MAFGRKMRRFHQRARRFGGRGPRGGPPGSIAGPAHPGFHPPGTIARTAVLPPAHTRTGSLELAGLTQLPFYRNQPWFPAYAAKHGIK